MSWCIGSQETTRAGSLICTAVKICSTLVMMLRLVSSTPAGVRVEPEVYCRKAGWSSGAVCSAASAALPSSVSSGLTQLCASESGRESMEMIRGRSAAGRSEKYARLAAADVLLVSTIDGLASPKTARRWSVWPGSFGS